MSIESLAELLRFQSELAVDRAKRDIEQQKATAEAFTPTPAQAAYIPTIFAPGSGIADASGVFPEFPSADVPLSEYLSGEPMPSIAENIAAGGIDRYLIAPLQGLGVAGDALYAVPGVGPLLGATLGSGLKGIGALGIAARAASKGAKTDGLDFLKISAQNKNIDLDIFDDPKKNTLSLSKIVVPEKNIGEGTKMMQEIIDYADSTNKKIVLTPSTDFGGSSVGRLKDFYKRFGFVENKGRNKDFEIRDTMYRVPTETKGKGIVSLEDNFIKADIDEFAKDEFGFVSPTLEALIREAPPNLKGPAINDWLAANTQKGVKPKELEVLGIDEFIKANPEATLSEVVAGVAPNKVQITKTVNYQGTEPPTIDFEVSTPEFDPLDGSLLYNPNLEDIQYELSLERPEAQELILDYYNKEIARNLPGTSSNPRGDPGPYKKLESFDEIEPYLREGSGSEYTGVDDVVEKYAKDQYFDNPYELVKVKSVGEIEANIPNQTFAFGNDDVGYQLFIGGERVTDPDNIAYSRTEAQIQLQNKLSEDGDPLRTVDGDPFSDIMPTGDAQYKFAMDETLPGGSNYREVSFNLKDAPETHNLAHPGLNPEGNYIAHALIRDRKLDDGVETLHVDELQSDLHTKGSRFGYRVPDSEFNRIKQEINPLLEGTPFTLIRHAADNQPGLAFAREGDLDGFVDLQKFDTLASKGNVEDSFKYDAGRSQKVLSELGEEKFDIFVEKIRPLIGEGQTPNYPFKDDWYVMSLKQLIKDAIDEGKDAISVSGSAPIKARYTDQYSKFYESLYDQKIPSAMKKLANKYGGKFEKGSLDLEDVYGKGMADLGEKQGTYLRYGREGKDPMIFEDLDKFEANIIRITPEMRAKIAEEGLPSFAYGGSVNRQKTLTMPQKTLTMPEDVNIFADAQFTPPETLTEKIVSGMTDLAFGRITKDDFFRDNVVRNVLTQLKVPSVIQNNLLRSEEAQNFALNTLQQAIGSPVDVTALGDDRFALDYSQKLGPGILSLASEFGKGEDTGRVSYDSKDFFVAPSTTARFAASLDKDRGKAFTTGVTYRPDPKTFVEGRAIFGEGRSPEYRIDFGRRF